MILDLGEHTGQDLQAQILFVTQPVCPALKDPDLSVHSFYEPEGDLVLGGTIGGNPLPMALDHLRKLPVGLQALPLQGGAPVRKEAARPAFPLVIPQLAERRLEQISGVQPLVGTEQGLKGTTA